MAENPRVVVSVEARPLGPKVGEQTFCLTVQDMTDRIPN